MTELVSLVIWVGVVLSAGVVMSTLALAARRLHLARAERRELEAEARLRPVAFALLDGEASEGAEIGPNDAKMLAALVARMGRQLSGTARERVGSFFEKQGGVVAEIRRLRRGSAWRRATAAHTLGEMASPDAIPALREALDDRSREVRGAAASSLGRLGAAEAVDDLVFALAKGRVPRAIAAQALLAIGPAALPSLRRLETAEAVEAREIAIELVGLLGDASDGPLLADRLRDASADVRAKAARALGRLGAKEGAAALRGALDDRIPFVRAAAAIAVGQIGDRDAAEQLHAVACGDDFAPARAAAYALARIDPSLLVGGPHLDEAADITAAGV